MRRQAWREVTNDEAVSQLTMSDVQQQDQQQYAQQQQPMSQAELDAAAVRAYGAQPRAPGYRAGAIRESRIKDRPQSKSLKDDSLSIKIELDLEVEVCGSIARQEAALANSSTGRLVCESEGRYHDWASMSRSGTCLCMMMTGHIRSMGLALLVWHRSRRSAEGNRSYRGTLI